PSRAQIVLPTASCTFRVWPRESRRAPASSSSFMWVSFSTEPRQPAAGQAFRRLPCSALLPRARHPPPAGPPRGRMQAAPEVGFVEEALQRDRFHLVLLVIDMRM